jgi:hypothetical protein
VIKPTEADREAAHATLANYWHLNNPVANADMSMRVAWGIARARTEERKRCIDAIRACPSLDENGYICEKAAAIAKIGSQE